MARGHATFTIPTTEESGPCVTPVWSRRTPTSSTWPSGPSRISTTSAPTWLDLAHKALDEAVFDAYGWDPSMTDEQILAALLKLNLERSASGDATPTGDEVEEEPEASHPD